MHFALGLAYLVYGLIISIGEPILFIKYKDNIYLGDMIFYLRLQFSIIIHKCTNLFFVFLILVISIIEHTKCSVPAQNAFYAFFCWYILFFIYTLVVTVYILQNQNLFTYYKSTFEGKL